MPRISVSKPHSFTTQTRLTQSNLINSSIDKNNSLMVQHIQNSQNKQSQFLKLKNSQLHERVIRMSSQISNLERSKMHLLKLNERYIKVVNEYYRKPKASTKSMKEGPMKSVLSDLERDYRNLVKHCLVMEQEIENYAGQMAKYKALKDQLASVNHTTAKELIEELISCTQQNKSLKMQNNRLMFELQKAQTDCKNMKKKKEESNGVAQENGYQLEKYKAMVRAIQQECKDVKNKDQAKIYQLQLKIEKLEKQMRRNQQYVNKNIDLRGKLEMQRVESVHKCEKLQKQISQYHAPRKSLHLRKTNQGTNSVGISYID